jgi:hypothetical protein
VALLQGRGGREGDEGEGGEDLHLDGCSGQTDRDRHGDKTEGGGYDRGASGRTVSVLYLPVPASMTVASSAALPGTADCTARPCIGSERCSLNGQLGDTQCEAKKAHVHVLVVARGMWCYVGAGKANPILRRTDMPRGAGGSFDWWFWWLLHPLANCPAGHTETD